ncbi:hypothetical protein DPX16_17144 [Anabarilius grahami]|uniref:Uncharacterized protein n=1 Tax=Anabarilius grahami TaxID=495550 RepID=A0A3N0YAQ8_ANAGA|nr:hypothetical protein DPX16_17144 [Anabarilius grahami]
MYALDERLHSLQERYSNGSGELEKETGDGELEMRITQTQTLNISSSEEVDVVGAEGGDEDPPSSSPAYEELREVVTRAVEKLNIDWPTEKTENKPKSKLDERFLPARSLPQRRGLPFFPDLHTELQTITPTQGTCSYYLVCVFSLTSTCFNLFNAEIDEIISGNVMDFNGLQMVEGQNYSFSAASKGFKRYQTRNKGIFLAKRSAIF